MAGIGPERHSRAHVEQGGTGASVIGAEVINGANTGFMLLAASLVMLMTPGLAFFYGGLVGRGSTLSIMIQSFASMGITTVLWWFVGYSLCFSGGSDGIYGNFHLALLRHVGVHSVYAPSKIPLVVLIAYQMMFAIITPALITGAFTNRVTFKAYLIFLVVWQLAVYYPFVHMIWGGGLLEHWGVRDFAGGIVVHASAGWAALASVLYVGKRRFYDSPHNIPFIALGTGLLWFGWYGFNAGSELKVDDITSLAFLNTDIAASFAATTWLFVEWWFGKKPHFVGLLTGAVAGLATHHAGRRLRPDLGLGRDRDRGRCRLLLRDPAEDAAEVGRRARRLGCARNGRPARDRAARRVRRHRDQPERRTGPHSRQRDVLLQAGCGRCRLLGVRLRVHLRDAEDHRHDHARPRDGWS